MSDPDDHDPRNQWLFELLQSLRSVREDLANASMNAHSLPRLRKAVNGLHYRVDQAIQYFTREFERYNSEVEDNAAAKTRDDAAVSSVDVSARDKAGS